MKKEITFKADDFKYPTADEIKFADSKCPKFNNFGFADNSVVISILQGQPVKEASIEDNLYWWDLLLKNRFGSLRGAYYDALTHYRRGFKDDYRECSDQDMVHRLLFDSNAEIFYYFFFVTTDVISQILNLFFQCNIHEDKVAFNNKLMKEISDLNVKQALKVFLDETRLARYFRNGFTHRFSVNYPDYRSKIETKEGKTVLHGGSGSYILPSKIIINMDESLNSLSGLMIDLKTHMAVDKT